MCDGQRSLVARDAREIVRELGDDGRVARGRGQVQDQVRARACPGFDGVPRHYGAVAVGESEGSRSGADRERPDNVGGLDISCHGTAVHGHVDRRTRQALDDVQRRLVLWRRDCGSRSRDVRDAADHHGSDQQRRRNDHCACGKVHVTPSNGIVHSLSG